MIVVSDSVRRRVCLAGLIAVIFAAPQAFGGNQPVARRLLLGAAAALFLMWPRRLGLRAIAPFGWAAVALLGLAALQLVPMPASWIRAISPRAAEVRGIALGDVAANEAQCLSLAPARTALFAEHLAMALLVCAVAGALAADERSSRALMFGLVGIGTFEAGYAMATSYTLGPTVWGHALPRLGRLSGTYVNSDHFAGLLAMVFPLALVLTRSTAPVRARSATWVLAIIRWIDRPKWAVALLAHGGAVLIALAVLLSLSRAAIAILGVATVFLTVLDLALSRAQIGRFAALGVVVGLVGATYAAFGTAPLAARFDALTEHAVERFEIARETTALVGDFPWLGAGFGAFEAVHPAYQHVPRIGLLVNSAHSDLLELASEAGMPAAVVVLGLALVPLVRLMRRVLSPERPREVRRVDAGLAAAWLVVLVRAAIDFDFRSPGNAVAAAAIAGLIAGRTTGDVSRSDTAERGAPAWPFLVAIALAVQALRPLEPASAMVERGEARIVQAQIAARLQAESLMEDLGGTSVSAGLRASMMGLAAEHQRRELELAVGELIRAYHLAVAQEPGEPRTHAKLSYWLAAWAANGEPSARALALTHAAAARSLFPVGDRWHVYTWVAELALDPADPRPLMELERITRRYPTELELLARLAAPLGLAEPIARTVPGGNLRIWRMFAATSLAHGHWTGAVSSLDRLVDASGIKKVASGSATLRFEARVRDGAPTVVVCARVNDGHAAHLVVERDWRAYAVALGAEGQLLLHEATSLYQLGTPPPGTIEARAVRFEQVPTEER